MKLISAEEPPNESSKKPPRPESTNSPSAENQPTGATEPKPTQATEVHDKRTAGRPGRSKSQEEIPSTTETTPNDQPTGTKTRKGPQNNNKSGTSRKSQRTRRTKRNQSQEPKGPKDEQSNKAPNGKAMIPKTKNYATKKEKSNVAPTWSQSQHARQGAKHEQKRERGKRRAKNVYNTTSSAHCNGTQRKSLNSKTRKEQENSRKTPKPTETEQNRTNKHRIH